MPTRMTSATAHAASAPIRGAPEYGVQVTLFRYLEAVLPDAVVYATENAAQPRSDSPQSRMAFHAKRRAKGIKPGIPDLSAVLPGPRILYCEVKAPGGTVSYAQQDVHRALRARGCVVFVADSIESCRAALLAAGIALRETVGQPTAEPRVHFAQRKLVNDEVPL